MSSRPLSRSFRTALLGAPLLLAPVLTITAPSVAAETCSIAENGVRSGNVHWGIKQSYRNYIIGNVARGGWNTEAIGFTGPEAGPSSTFDFSPADGSSAVGNALTVPLQGSIVFAGHDYGQGPLLEMTLSDFAVQVEGSTGYVIVDYVSYTSDMTSKVKGDRITGDDRAIAEIRFSSPPDLTASTVTLEGDVMLTGAGEELFVAYQAGEPLDRIQATFSCSGTAGHGGGGTGTGGGARSHVNLPDYTDGLAMLKEANDTMFSVGTLMNTSLGMLDDAERFYARTFGRDELSEAAANGQPVATGGRPTAVTTGGDGGAGGAGGGTTGSPATGGGSGSPVAPAAGSVPATVMAAGASGVIGGAVADGDVCSPDGGVGVLAAQAQWGVKRSFQSYITGSIAKGQWELNGIGHGDGRFLFEGDQGAVRPAERAGSLLFPGALRFTGHGGVLDLRISDLEIRFQGNSGELIATVTSSDMEGNSHDFGRATIAALDFSALDVSDTAAAGQASARLTESGARAFSDFYAAGTELDPITFSATLGGAANCAAGQGAASGGAAAAGGTAVTGAPTSRSGDSDAVAGVQTGTDSLPSGNSGGFRVKTAGTSGDMAGNTFNTVLLLIIASMVVVGGTLTRFVSRNPLT